MPGQPQSSALSPQSYIWRTDTRLRGSSRFGAAKARNLKPERLNTVPTIRQKIISLLIEAELSALEISGEVGISEKEVYEHLPHIARSVASQNKMVLIAPAICLRCGYVFKGRSRFTCPGRCPQCKKSHIQSPTFRIS
jgi:predicted Zn-ribbon and HTH transcriptional regulator